MLRWFALGLIGIAFSFPVLAQSANDTITVTGKQFQREEAKAISRAFVRKLSAVPASNQYARWKAPVCPKTIGIAAAADTVIVAKIRAVAEQVGAPLAKPGCRANLVVTFTDNAPALMRVLEKKHPKELGPLDAAEKEALLGDAMPVRWVYATRVEAADGHQMNALSPAINNVVDIPQSGDGGYLGTYYSSLISSKLRVNLTSVGVVVDTRLAEGRKLDAVAAYIAMVGLARIKAAETQTGLPTILQLFSGAADAPQDLTPWDLAYLTALYKVPVDRPAATQQAMIIGEMTKTLAGK